MSKLRVFPLPQGRYIITGSTRGLKGSQGWPRPHSVSPPAIRIKTLWLPSAASQRSTILVRAGSVTPSSRLSSTAMEGSQLRGGAGGSNSPSRRTFRSSGKRSMRPMDSISWRAVGPAGGDSEVSVGSLSGGSISFALVETGSGVRTIVSPGSIFSWCGRISDTDTCPSVPALSGLSRSATGTNNKAVCRNTARPSQP